MARKVAFLLFPGFEALDFYGPMSVFGSRKLEGAYQLLTVSQTAGPVPNSTGVSTLTEYSFETCPRPDILLVVGGSGTRKEVENKEMMSFLHHHGPSANESSGSWPYLLTVCTGAALAARAGLLNGRRATTNKAAWAWATAQGEPGAITWKEQARWVEDGPVWTSAGVTAGMDMALAFVARHNGEEAAQQVAGYLEYSGDFRNASNDAFWHIIEKRLMRSADETLQGAATHGLCT